MRFLFLALTMLSGLACASGCGRQSAGATATGTVTIDGRPAPSGIRVDFLSVAAGGSMSTGYTDDSGRYDLFFNANLRGVMPGDCIVRLSLSETTGADGLPAIPEALRHIRIPASFGEQSETIRTVNPGANTIDLDVTTADARSAPR